MDFRNLVDQKYIKDAEKIKKEIRTLNISLKDYTSSAKRKKEIQSLIQKHHFPEFDIFNQAVNTININTLNQRIGILKNKYESDFLKVYEHTPEGIGPGEILLYFLVNTAYLSGRSESTDITIGNTLYEVKAARITADSKRAYGFFLGGSVSFSSIIEKLKKLNNDKRMGGNNSDIGVTVINKMRELYPTEFNPIEEEYKEVVYREYFKSGQKNLLVFNNNQNKKGIIQVIKSVSKDDISMERYTSNSIKPYIRINNY